MTEVTENQTTIDSLFEEWRTPLGADFVPYRNHVYRVFNLSVWWSAAVGVDVEKVAIAAAFHDIGIWLDGTFDYIEPSVVRAAKYLQDNGSEGWDDEVATMIRDHHKILATGADRTLIEAFRRADWLDVSLFALPTSHSRAGLRSLLEVFPRAGFHRRLVEIGLAWGKRHPFRPLPMLKL